MIDFYMELIEKKLNILNKYKEKLIVLYGYPLKKELFFYDDIEFEELLDAITYKFNKLQSLIGEKVFKYLLEYAGINCEEKSFLEILSILEKEGILKIDKWRKLRIFRNSFSHIYPQEILEIVEGVNEMVVMIDYLNEVFENIKNYKRKIDETYKRAN